ncbi:MULTISPECIES: class-II fumarase/aspartase family protein [Actinobacillus]|uniref:3-carboxy-cis,cis-muconate cycloisomerase n=1 Tax=Actinobacillus lignieresii TaxID=720 RepID=A0A380TTF1_ACTLI|nr:MULTISPECIES: adenylosuccinate lyase family protein [Actinobacillus]WGE34902.1 adenylosuccinate lyase family protein [Actinobacillus genomosp. 1]WGE36885.1 adenylosuccinate lyase family protein [Actinobacillus genomosp. 1]WGE89823.1 adenylosuccinate lyase family protein [Actinobacillus arthritidis]SUT90893.1 3-carboxy-cis,cis-muconate cycloisomerase [Actinobacillus lignieresii]VEB25692.1 argininosuccinate lyase [Actinobacillus lignieresii]
MNIHSAISVFDTYMYSPLFTQTEMKKIWSEEYQIKCWLQFEKTVAKVQAKLGIIPYEAVPAIQLACDNLIIDWLRLSEETQVVGMPIKPIIDQITDNGDELVKKYLHWGCTTQDLLDSSLAIRLRESLILIRNQLINLGEQLEDSILKHQHTVMVARTNAIDASATTWGLQVSSYLNEICRHIIRLDQLYPRVIVGMYGGAVGNLASVGDLGMEVRNQLCIELGLAVPKGLNNASQDQNVEVIQFFALIHGTLCRIANDIEIMCRTPIYEASEGQKGGGSSTMPHKTNPRDCNMLQTLSRMGWMYASGAPNMLDQQDVRSASMRMLSWNMMPEACLAISTALCRAEQLFKNLIINTDRMRENFNASYYFIMSESVMMTLADKIGRQSAYKLMQKVLSGNNKLQSMMDLLLCNQEINKVLSADEIMSACEPMNYLGCNDQLIQESLVSFNQLKK